MNAPRPPRRKKRIRKDPVQEASPSPLHRVVAEPLLRDRAPSIDARSVVYNHALSLTVQPVANNASFWRGVAAGTLGATIVWLSLQPR